MTRIRPSVLARALATGMVAAALLTSFGAAPAPAAPARPQVACDEVDPTRAWFNYTLGQTFSGDLKSVSAWQIAVVAFKPFSGALAGRLVLYPAADPVGALGPGIVLAEATAPAKLRARELKWLEFKPTTPVALPLTASKGRYGIEIDFPVDTRKPQGDWSALSWMACGDDYREGSAFHVNSAESFQRRYEQAGVLPGLPRRLPTGGVERAPHQYQAFTFKIFGA